MPRFPTAQRRSDTIPSFLATARTFYGEAFGPGREPELAESMADWAELTEEERSFALAHLQYLNLVAQAGTQRMLARACELLEELVEYAKDAAFGDGEDAEDQDDGEAEDVVDPEEWQLPLEAFVQPPPDDVDADEVLGAVTAAEEALDQEGVEPEEVPDAAE